MRLYCQSLFGPRRQPQGTIATEKESSLQMVTGRHTSQHSSSSSDEDCSSQSQDLVVATRFIASDSEERQIALKTIVPATLPPSSRAAAAQRLNDRPLNNIRGVYYPVPHTNANPDGWRTKRHLKRKKLRFNNLQTLAVERLGTWGAMLPMASIALVCIVILSGILVTFSAVVAATQERYGHQILTLQDILPKDSL